MRAVIFDFDGVILDSEPQHHESFRRLFQRHAVPFCETPDDFTGIGARDNIRRVYRKTGLDLSDAQLQQLNHERDALYQHVLEETGIRTLPGAAELIRAIHQAGVKVALASSTNSAVLAEILPRIGLQAAFDAVVGGDQVRRGKPSPDIFLRAAEMLGVPPSACVVVEDSNAGVQAAKAAGMKVLMVRNERINQQKSKADAFVDSLVTVDLRMLSAL